MTKITKAFTTQYQVKKFKKQWVNGDIETDCVQNSMTYLGKWWNLRETMGTAANLLFFFDSYLNEALTDYFGKHDFQFVGNRKCYNWMLRYKDRIFIGPSHLEVVTDNINAVDPQLLLEMKLELLQLSAKWMLRPDSASSIHPVILEEIHDAINKNIMLPDGTFNFQTL